MGLEAIMTVPLIGEMVRISYANDSAFRYVLHVEVLSVAEKGLFVGRVERVFAQGNGEITGGEILDEVKGKAMNFSLSDLIT
jgi:hypothetical protein